jgi:hypothetical protein
VKNNDPSLWSRQWLVLSGVATLVGRKKMSWCRQFAALIIVLALAGCARAAAGPEQTPNAPYQQDDTRDTSGMH